MLSFVSQPKRERRERKILALTPKQKNFISYYLNSFNITNSAQLAGYEIIYSSCKAYELLNKTKIKNKIIEIIKNNFYYYSITEEEKATINSEAKKQLKEVRKIYINKKNSDFFYFSNIHRKRLQDNFFYELDNNIKIKNKILNNKTYNLYFKYLQESNRQIKKFICAYDFIFYETSKHSIKQNEINKLKNLIIHNCRKQKKIIDKIEEFKKQ